MTALNDLTDVVITSLATGDLLYTMDGMTWVNVQPGMTSGIQPYNANTSFTNVAETRSADIDMNNNQLKNAQLVAYSETAQNITSSASVTLDLTQANVFVINQSTDIPTLQFTGAASSGLSSDFTIIRIKDSSSSAYAITWPASVRWVGGVAPSLTQTANAVDTLEFFTTDGGVTWYGFVSGLNMR